MYIYLSKILPLFVMPLSLALWLLLATIFFFRQERRKTAGALLAVTFILLWVTSMPLVAKQFYRDLEAQFPPIPLAEVPVADCLILLGGVVAPAVAPRVDTELNESIDRVYKSAQLYRAGKVRSLIVTAGNQPWSTSPWAEADLISDLLVEWGVPKEVIFLEGSSRNTRENALYSRNLVDSINCQQSLLVTSAAHMPRAVAAFRGAGIAVVPVSTDVRVEEGSTPTFMDYLPSAGALEMTSGAIREWIGQVFYSLQGWN